MVHTDIPREVLPLMVDLSLRVKDGNVRSVVFKSGVAGFSSSSPDFTLMRERVQTALDETRNPKSTKPKKKKTSSGTTVESEDVNDSCAYDPKIAETARPYR